MRSASRSAGPALATTTRSALGAAAVGSGGIVVGGALVDDAWALVVLPSCRIVVGAVGVGREVVVIAGRARGVDSATDGGVAGELASSPLTTSLGTSSGSPLIATPAISATRATATTTGTLRTVDRG